MTGERAPELADRRLRPSRLSAFDHNYLEANRIFVAGTDTGEYLERRDVAIVGCGLPVAAAHFFLNERLLELPQVRLYAGLVEDEVVATSMLVATGAVAGIYRVATLEDQRGRGYGEALTSAAVAGDSELGCRHASLQASKLGRPVYARMGFEHALDYEYLHPPEP